MLLFKYCWVKEGWNTHMCALHESSNKKIKNKIKCHRSPPNAVFKRIWAMCQLGFQNHYINADYLNGSFWVVLLMTEKIICLNNWTSMTVDPQNDNLTLASLVVITKRTENLKNYGPFTFSLSRKEKGKKMEYV